MSSPNGSNAPNRVTVGTRQELVEGLTNLLSDQDTASRIVAAIEAEKSPKQGTRAVAGVVEKRVPARKAKRSRIAGSECQNGILQTADA